MGFAIMRFAKIKDVNAGNALMRHIRREVPIKSLSRPENRNVYISSSDVNINKNISFKNALKSRIGDQKIRKNSVLGLEIIMTFTNGCIKEDKVKDWAKKSMDWICDNFGGPENIVISCLHKDEKVDHIHVIIQPFYNGKLNCKHYIDGPASCRKLQDSYFEAVKDCGDLDRGISSKITEAKNENHKRWIAQQAKKESELQAYKKVFGNKLTKDQKNMLDYEILKNDNSIYEERGS